MFLRKLIAVGAFALMAGVANANEGPLVTTEWLEENLGSADIAVIEVSVNPGVYERGHIPGAVNFAWHTDLVDPVRRDIATREDLQARLQAAGVSDDTTIILYGDTNNWFAAWGAWVFDVYGLEDVKLLDGGRVAWEAEGRPLDSAVPAPAAGTVTLAEANNDLRAFLPEVVAASDSGSHAIVDIRSANEYSGTIIAPEGFQETAIRAGHVTGAVNVPWSSAVAEDGRFKSPDELRAIYAAAGVDGSKPVITYCRIGERSSHTWFALSRILGYDVQNYDGSWTEYGNSVGVPVTNPAGTVWTGL
ncbi:sulfurtransferase [Ketogulonicigenium vulgare]|uniref:Sulfurtransferase n=1 Tax=Ketogulonicigenium vulgare (strain WSH-001) TaxID=759362 RepID=F9Y762_KETVW|nr:sulfurtransferase [Ketogulonicigenium vulgare]ADO41257.1 rhodanese domain-containing protein [Ketogulonicigenium vulgare Y25]AEM42252.1 Rhodanese-like protein domain protein [Ketogulonicigenium vulgare WSH-001]ALJ79870.1 thiosulfate sulfurtransferase [Ketogulonicigenium vulgare]ANW32774.1 thiosulfate sulfurtransferase [Ketogulonicigenium vulgare]AOZ53084.1 rhodanese domain-containing protein [Ketogulonicigenium vulgare]